MFLVTLEFVISWNQAKRWMKLDWLRIIQFRQIINWIIITEFRHWINLHQFCYNNKENVKSYLLNCISQFSFESAYIFRIERPFSFQLDLNENVGKSIQKGIFAKRKGSCNGEICCYLEINQENWTYILCKKLYLHAKYWVCIQVNKEANYSVWCNRLVTKSLV